MKYIKTINKTTYNDRVLNGGCGECQNSCQSACKTSCTVANQKCESLTNLRIDKNLLSRIK
ncbi:six-cysteine peptide SCIFF [Lutispora thermophila DSM 19022]|uniref:Six-cysteine peptide SCIFF n=1 Tax=Lutispora thermophila DSM 19022 TaxID=1122184 RepID=A0A1M6HPA8_9FIRM|nr:six-cysteine peptide SCIFF [Lutispora thermophila DSM 19022]